jgi:hypothetical protein
MAQDPNQRPAAMLRILLATCLATRDALDAADNPVDRQFRDDLDRLITRTEAELAAFGNP